MGYIWANWAWAGSGHAHVVPAWSTSGLTGHGLEVGKPMWFPHGLHVG